MYSKVSSNFKFDFLWNIQAALHSRWRLVVLQTIKKYISFAFFSSGKLAFNLQISSQKMTAMTLKLTIHC